MKCSFDPIGSLAVDSDVLFLYVCELCRLFGQFTEDTLWELQAVEKSRKAIMAEGEDQIELKFRIYDGTDIGHSTYASSMTVGTLKQRLVTEWPQDKTVTPKSVNDLKIIHAGKVLENSKTLADSRVTFGDLPAGVVTMLVVVQPPAAKKKPDKNEEDMKKPNPCSCRIL